MTTIAWSKGLLACDSQGTVNGGIQPANLPKIMIPPEDEYWEVMGNRVVVIAFAGQYPVLPWFIEALNVPGGITHRTRMGLDIALSGSILAIDEKGLGWEVSVKGQSDEGLEKLIVQPVFTPYAIGSGRPYANAVMAMGRDAKKAIQVAIRMDIYSGGIVQSFELPEPVTTKTKRPEPGSPNICQIAPDPYGPLVPHPHQPPLQPFEDIESEVNTDPIDSTPVARP